MKKKRKLLLRSYLSVLILALSLYAWVGQTSLDWYRRTANESASLAYEEAVRSVQALSAVLDQSAYATDSEMCDRICLEACSHAAAAESALSTLPFSTWELEQLSAYLNTVMDYTRSICGQGQPFSRQQRQELGSLAARGDAFSRKLLDLRQGLQDREIRMDSREKRLRNVGEETGPLLSGELLAYEAAFQPVELRYDGLYGAGEKRGGGLLTEQEMLAAAADFAGVPESELEPLLEYRGAEGRRCYQTGDRQLCVSRSGVESCSCSRLVWEENLDPTRARRAAEDFLRARGFGSLELLEEEQRACLAVFTYARVQDGVLCPDSILRLAIALDDGSVYFYDASAYDPEPVSVTWSVDEESARGALPEGLEEAEVRPCILRSPGGRALPCYVFSAADDQGRPVEIAVRADTGRQFRIRVGESSPSVG